MHVYLLTMDSNKKTGILLPFTLSKKSYFVLSIYIYK